MIRDARLALLLLTSLYVPAEMVLAAQPLSDFRRVVVSDNALPVQMEAATELAHYVGRGLDGPVRRVLPGQRVYPR